MSSSIKNREYWRKRTEQLQESLLSKSDTYYDDLERQYKLAFSDTEKEISAWYMRFAKNNSITYVEAKKRLNANELKEFRWTIEEYIKYGEENAVNQNWIKQLENASAKYHITRLESLMIQLQQKMELFFGNQLDDVDKLIKNTYTEGYFHTAYELQKGFNVGFTLQAFNENELEKVVSKPWTTDGTNFSERIWGNYRPELINELQTQLTQTIIKGKSPDSAIKAIAKKFNNTRAQAGNLVMTESSYFSSLSRNDCYKDLGIGDFEIVSTLDMKTSEICRELDGEHFPLKDYQVGVTAPPFHNFCRTTTCPYFDDEFTLGENRAARGIDDKTEYVDGNMKYDDWHDKYVTSNPNGLTEEKKAKNKSYDKKQFYKYKEVLGSEAPKSFDKFQDLKYNNVNRWEEIKIFTDAKSNGRISNDATLKQWDGIIKEVNDKVIGVTTPNGIEISELSHHGIERFIGDGEKRKCVLVEDVRNALIKPLDIKEIKIDNLGRKSQKFIGEKATISINPETGNIIQTNPTSSKLAERLKRRVEDDKIK